MLKKIIKNLVLLFTLILCNNSIAEQEFKTILGTTNKSASTGKNLGGFCSATDYKTLSENYVVFIVGIKTCNSQHTSPIDFYEIALNGDKYYVAKESLDISATDKEKISTYTQDDWKQAEDEGIGASSLVRKKEIDQLLSTINKLTPKGLAILEWSVVDESEYTEGTGVKIDVYNPTKKVIKYIWFTLQGYNPVKDATGSVVTLRAVGPIEPDSSGKYRFEYTWHTDIVETAKFKKVRVQYMDGTFKTITKPSEILLSSEILAIFDSIE